MPRIQTQQERLSAGAAPIVAPVSIPSPVKGWNTRDEFDAMDPLDAVQLDNWFPDAGGCVVRNGYQPYASGLGSVAVSTLATLNVNGVNKFLAACGGKIWDISSSGTPGSALASGFTSDQWQTVGFLSKLFFVNGSDTAQIYDGTTISNASFTGVTLSSYNFTLSS